MNLRAPRLRFLVLLATCLVAASPLGAQTPEISARLLAPTSATAGETIPLTVEMTLGAEWHVNSHNPFEDWVIPTDVEVRSSQGSAGPVRYPPHEVKTFSFSEEPLAVYEGTVRFETEVSLPADSTGSVDVVAVISYQACNDQQCFRPEKLPVTATIPLLGTTPSSGPQEPVTIETPVPEEGEAETTPRRAQPPEETWNVRGVPTVLFLDSSGREVPGTRLAGMEKPRDFLLRLDHVEAGGGEASDEVDVEEMLGERGLVLTLVAMFVLGLLLNLTPCVYPVIPITVGYFSNQQDRSRAGKFLLATLYVLGMAVVYSSIGVAAAFTGGLFGAALQSAWATAFIALVLTVLALGMFGAYELQAPQAILRLSGPRTGALGALVMGALVGFVAAPCIGPAVLGILTWVATTRDPILGFAIFFVLALGLGAPYLLLAVTSASLPRAGSWMVAIKHVFGVLMLAVAAWFAKSLPLVNSWMDGFWLPAAVLVVGGLWLALFEKEGRDRPFFRWVIVAVGLFSTVLGVWLVRPLGERVELEWQPYSTEALEAARAEGRPVIVDFYADWCIPCKELDRVTFPDPRVAARLGDYVRLKVDLTDADVDVNG